MPQYGRYSLASHSFFHRLLVVIEELYDVTIEVRRVKTLDVRSPALIQADALGPKPRYFCMTIWTDRLMVETLVRAILPEELADARSSILVRADELLKIALNPERCVDLITSRRPTLDGPRRISFTPRVAKVWETLQALNRPTGIVHCRSILRQRYGSFADHALNVFADAGLIWAHPLSDVIFVARRIKVSVKQPLTA